MRGFEVFLSSPAEELEIKLERLGAIPWADFFLNPRRLRGSDFLMRWSQGVWSEHRISGAVAETGTYFALPYGPSSVAPDDPKAFELYFEELDAAGLQGQKRPDLLVFPEGQRTEIGAFVKQLGGEKRLPFVPEEKLKPLIDRAIVAVESENSLWVAKQMPNYQTALRPQRRLGGQMGHAANAVLPTVIIKDEDRAPLRQWQDSQQVPIHVWHIFFDIGLGLALDEAERLIATGRVIPTKQVYQAPGGATTTKLIYKFPHYLAYPLSEVAEPPQLVADQLVDKNGHILPYVRFEGGRMKLASEALEILNQLRNLHENH